MFSDVLLADSYCLLDILGWTHGSCQYINLKLHQILVLYRDTSVLATDPDLNDIKPFNLIKTSYGLWWIHEMSSMLQKMYE